MNINGSDDSRLTLKIGIWGEKDTWKSIVIKIHLVILMFVIPINGMSRWEAYSAIVKW